YLLEESQPAAVVDGGGILVSVPHPARFALHKLLVARSRPPSLQTKSDKDVRQAAQLIDVLARDRAGDLVLAWEALARRGRTWTRLVLDGTRRLEHRAPSAH